MNDPLKKILKLNKIPEDQLESLSTSIMADAQKRFPTTTITNSISTNSEVEEENLKEFGLGGISVDSDSKLMTFEVVNDDTIEYEVDGELQKFAFDVESMKRLGEKLEGVPVVIGDAHDADLPLAYFTGVTSVDMVDGRNLLMAEAKLRIDEDAPFNFESLVQNPALDVNGGVESIGGSLKFYSKDVPVEFENGVKVNYMTGASPRHYALLNSPVFETAGLKAKNFGENQEENLGEQMTDELKTVPEVNIDVTKEIDEALDVRLKELNLGEMSKEAAADAVKGLIVDLAKGQEDMVQKADFDALSVQLKEAEEKLATIARDAVVSEIRHKELGDAPTEEATEAFEARVKEFGMDELHGYNAALDVAKEQIKAAEEKVATRKDFGKGKISTDNQRKARKIQFGPSAGKTA